MSITNDGATGVTGQGVAAVETPEGAGVWVPLTTAAELQGVSLRTLQRRAAAGGVLVREGGSGRREAFVTRQRRGDATGQGVAVAGSGGVQAERQGPTAGGDVDATGAVLVRAFQAGATLAERRADEAGAELMLARDSLVVVRRSAGRAWATAAAVGIMAGVGAVWGVQAVGRAEQRAVVADARGAGLEDLAAELRGRAERAERIAEPWGPWPLSPESVTNH